MSDTLIHLRSGESIYVSGDVRSRSDWNKLIRMTELTGAINVAKKYVVAREAIEYVEFVDDRGF